MENFQDLFLRLTAVVSAEKPGKVINSIEDLAKAPQCHMETWVLSALQHSIGFTFALTTTNIYGEFEASTHVWNGMAGSLLNGTSDLAISTTVMLPLRCNIVDYSFPLGFTPDFMAFYRRPSIAFDSWALTRPFHPYLWLSIVMFIIITSILFGLILLSKRSLTGRKRSVGSSSKAMYSGLLWSIGAISLKSHCSLNVSKASIILFLAFSPTALIINAAYNGMLLSFISIPSEPFKRFYQLMTKSFTFVLDNHLQFVAEDLETRPDTKGFMKAVQQPLEAPRGLKSVKRDILRGSFAFICLYYNGYADLRDNFTVIERASVAELTVLNGKTSMHALMLPKGSPYKQLINFQLLKLMQGGVNKQWSTRLRIRRPDSGGSVPHQAISLVSIVVAAVVFASGFVVASSILLCEIWYIM